MAFNESADTGAPKNVNFLRLRNEIPLPEHKTTANLDELDLAIIEAQQRDPFFSYAELAEEKGVTAATVRNRIKRLKSTGVIDVVMVVNPYKLGYDTFAIIGIRIHTGASPEKLVEALQAILGVSNIAMVTGSFDFFVTYTCRNLEEYRLFINNELRKLPEIASFENFLGLDIYERKYLLGMVT